MLNNKDMRLMKLKNRVTQLNKKPENYKIVAKLRRQIRNLEMQ